MIRRAAALALVAMLPGLDAAACEQPAWRETPYQDSIVVDAATTGTLDRAWYADPVTRYRHFVLGRHDEPATLWVYTEETVTACGFSLTLERPHVFEDVAPHLADLDGDGTNEVIVVRSHEAKGAQLAIYRWTGADLVLDATTPYIGTPNRWLAVVGAADLDGDGAIEIAYIDRPHLARTLRVWRYDDGSLAEVATLSGVTNHRIGERFISGGIRTCGAVPEMLMADARWSRVLAVRFQTGALSVVDLGAFRGPESFAAALDCRVLT